jgi:flagellar motor switch protein FliM
MPTSSPVLTHEEVAALVDAMQSGDLDTSATEASSAAVQPYSLVANDTTTRGQLAALEMINDRFSRQLRGGLLTLLRQAVKITVLPFDVMTFSAYLKTLSSPSNVNIVRFTPLRGYGLVTLVRHLRCCRQLLRRARRWCDRTVGIARIHAHRGSHHPASDGVRLREPS